MRKLRSVIPGAALDRRPDRIRGDASPTHAEATPQNDGSEFWPTEDQELLLRAALSSRQSALAAWKTWKSRNHLIESELDQGSLRLLPLVYKNLAVNGVADDSLVARLKGVYRYFWCANQQLFYEAATILEHLRAAGIRTMILKGAALSALYYRDGGVRPMADVDVLVPYHQTGQALECLAQMGWRPSSRVIADDLRFRHAAQLVNDKGREFHLHWHVFYECIRPDDDDDLWGRARPTEMLHAPTHTLCPTDILLHTIVHGIHWNPVPPIRWIVDAMTILRTSGHEMDWELVLEQAERRNLLLRFRRGLGYLCKRFDAPVPPEVIRRLNRRRPSYWERIEYSYIALGPEGRSRVFFGYYPFILLGYFRFAFASGQSTWQRVAALPEYMRYRLQLHTRMDVLWTVLGDAVRKTRKILAPRRSNGRP